MFPDKPSPEFSAALSRFTPSFTVTSCARELTEFLLILNDGPDFVKDCVRGYFLGVDRLGPSYFMPVTRLEQPENTPGEPLSPETEDELLAEKRAEERVEQRLRFFIAACHSQSISPREAKLFSDIWRLREGTKRMRQASDSAHPEKDSAPEQESN